MMTSFLLCMALLVGQSQSPQPTVVRLPEHADKIAISDGGKTVELLQAAPVVYLPQQPPHISLNGVPWYVDVTNLGPGNVTLQGNSGFRVQLKPHGFAHIRSLGTRYAVTNR